MKRTTLLALALALAAGASASTVGTTAHNPGNIKGDRWHAWQGAVGVDAWDHIRFKSDFWGLRAIRENLKAYGRQGVDTPYAIGSRWGSLHATKAQRRDYARMLCQVLRCGPDAKLDMTDAATLRALARGIVRQENGFDPYPASLYDRVFVVR